MRDVVRDEATANVTGSDFPTTQRIARHERNSVPVEQRKRDKWRIW